MKWSWKLGTFASIDVYMHATFLLLLGWVALSHWVAGRTLGHVVHGVAFILALFLCVVLHEYGHALSARRFGIRTRDITLLPIGGLARLERMPEDPRQEIWVALGGPAVNVLIAAVLFVWLYAIGTFEPLEGLSVAGGSFLERLMVVNVSLVPGQAPAAHEGQALRYVHLNNLPECYRRRVPPELAVLVHDPWHPE